ncbi:hypothetical protein PLICRDRAFT_694984 [Plicaturopsis crispa FD-325 SS-3]|nr:hypothetical protein PLICRDRAFT_694984 [Plicaturopsis crispa FD-325 SS-3]
MAECGPKPSSPTRREVRQSWRDDAREFDVDTPAGQCVPPQQKPTPATLPTSRRLLPRPRKAGGRRRPSEVSNLTSPPKAKKIKDDALTRKHRRDSDITASPNRRGPGEVLELLDEIQDRFRSHAEEIHSTVERIETRRTVQPMTTPSGSLDFTPWQTSTPERPGRAQTTNDTSSSSSPVSSATFSDISIIAGDQSCDDPFMLPLEDTVIRYETTALHRSKPSGSKDSKENQSRMAFLPQSLVNRSESAGDITVKPRKGSVSAALASDMHTSDSSLNRYGGPPAGRLESIVQEFQSRHGIATGSASIYGSSGSISRSSLSSSVSVSDATGSTDVPGGPFDESSGTSLRTPCASEQQQEFVIPPLQARPEASTSKPQYPNTTHTHEIHTLMSAISERAAARLRTVERAAEADARLELVLDRAATMMAPVYGADDIVAADINAARLSADARRRQRTQENDIAGEIPFAAMHKDQSWTHSDASWYEDSGAVRHTQLAGEKTMSDRRQSRTLYVDPLVNARYAHQLQATDKILSFTSAQLYPLDSDEEDNSRTEPSDKENRPMLIPPLPDSWRKQPELPASKGLAFNFLSPTAERYQPPTNKVQRTSLLLSSAKVSKPDSADRYPTILPLAQLPSDTPRPNFTSPSVRSPAPFVKKSSAASTRGPRTLRAVNQEWLADEYERSADLESAQLPEMESFPGTYVEDLESGGAGGGERPAGMSIVRRTVSGVFGAVKELFVPWRFADAVARR